MYEAVGHLLAAAQSFCFVLGGGVRPVSTYLYHLAFLSLVHGVYMG